MAHHGAALVASSSPASFDTSSFDKYFESVIALIAEAIPDELYNTDGSREVGVVAIAAWHHGIAALASKHNVPVPPVLLSTIGMLVVLCIIKGVGGKGASSPFVAFFEPGVGFLGDWMALWLVPSLVLFPNALQTVERPSGKDGDSAAVMWVKLIVVHFLLWCLSTAGTAKIFHLVEQALPPAPPGGPSPASAPAPAPRPAPNAAAERAAKQLRLLRFWGVVTAGFYAAPAVGMWAASPGTLAPALAGTTITSLCAGTMLPPSVKKVIHPLLVAAVASGVAAIVADRFYAPGSAAAGSVAGGAGGGGDYCVRSGDAWQESLHFFTSPSAPPRPGEGPRARRAGDYFNLLLGPSVVALAFRIFSSSEDPQIAARMPAVLLSSSLSALLSLLISPALAAAVGVPSRLSSALAHRSVSSALAIPSAKATGASPELAVAAVLLTGLYGASGQWLLDRCRVKDDVTTGVAVGSASHAVGTASLLTSNPAAAAIASVGMVAAGIFHAVVCSIPGVSGLLQRLAAGGKP